MDQKKLKDWLAERRKAADNYDATGHKDAAEDLRRETDEIGKAYGKGDPKAIAEVEGTGEFDDDDEADDSK